MEIERLQKYHTMAIRLNDYGMAKKIDEQIQYQKGAIDRIENKGCIGLSGRYLEGYHGNEIKIDSEELRFITLEKLNLINSKYGNLLKKIQLGVLKNKNIKDDLD